jgi:UDP-GlcNAc:undecaprenyl-phosphate GlcNAc-1-phosphate transferase
MRLGHGHRRTVIVLWTWTFLLSALVLYPSFYPSWGGAIPIGLLVLAAALYTLFQPGLRKDPSLENREQVLHSPSVRRLSRSAVDSSNSDGLQQIGTLETADRATSQVSGATASIARDARREAAVGAHSGKRRRRFARHYPPTRQ